MSTASAAVDKGACAITGAAELSGAEAFDCVMGVSPAFMANFFSVLFISCLILWWLRLSWQALSSKNRGDYDWGQFMGVFLKPMMAITFMVAYLIFI